jgi:hypothetical protein
VIGITLCAPQLAPWRRGAGQNRETGTQFCHLHGNPLNPASRIDVQEGRERGAGQADREKVRKITFFLCGKTPQNVQRICNRLNALEGGSHGSPTEARVE